MIQSYGLSSLWGRKRKGENFYGSRSFIKHIQLESKRSKNKDKDKTLSTQGHGFITQGHGFIFEQFDTQCV